MRTCSNTHTHTHTPHMPALWNCARSHPTGRGQNCPWRLHPPVSAASQAHQPACLPCGPVVSVPGSRREDRLTTREHMGLVAMFLGGITRCRQACEPLQHHAWPQGSITHWALSHSLVTHVTAASRVGVAQPLTVCLLCPLCLLQDAEQPQSQSRTPAAPACATMCARPSCRLAST